MKECNSFLAFTEKRKYYLDCLVDIRNYLTRHSGVLKYYKLNNQKGLEKLIDGFIGNLDKFVDYGDEIELTLTNDGRIE